MRKILFLFLFVIVVRPVAGQEKCALTVPDAPAFFGLRLGQTTPDVRRVFGKSLKMKTRKEGAFFQNFIKKSPPPLLSGVRALYLRFYDYKIYQIEIFYQTEIKNPENSPQALARFVAALSADKRLPADLWETDNGKARLTCAEFSLVADDVLNPRIELTDSAAAARIDAGRRKNEKKIK